MFGGGTSFMPLMGQLKLAQAPTPGQAPAPAPSTPSPAPPVTPPAPAQAAAPAPAPVVTGMSHGTQVAIAATLAGLSLLGAMFLSD
jgi:hypothetical protein